MDIIEYIVQNPVKTVAAGAVTGAAVGGGVLAMNSTVLIGEKTGSITYDFACNVKDKVSKIFSKSEEEQPKTDKQIELKLAEMDKEIQLSIQRENEVKSRIELKKLG